MIQRIQTIYLFLAAIISGGFIFIFDLWTTIAGKKIYAMDLLNQSDLMKLAIPVFFLASAVELFASIFIFRKRQLQFVIVRTIILTHLILLGILIYLSLTLSGETTVSEKGIGMFLPVIVIVLCVLANKRIKKDEDLVKSVDRIR